MRGWLISGAWVLVWTMVAGAQQANPADGDRHAERYRERWQRIRDASPEELRDMRLERMVSMMTRTYELNDEQRVQVRQALREMRDQQRAEQGSHAEQGDLLRTRMREYWIKRMEARDKGVELPRPSEDPEFEAMRSGLRDHMRKHPFDWPTAMQRVEKFLTPEQVKKGHQRREEWLNRTQNVWDDFSNRAIQPQAPGVVPQPGQLDAYTRDFIRKYALDGAQIRSAQSTLRDLQERARLLRRMQEGARAQAPSKDPAVRAEQLRDLDEPFAALFDELKSRLDSLLTETQRAHPVE